MKYQEWLSEWLNNYVMPSSKQRTYTRYEEIVMQHIVPHLGEYEIAELSPIIFQKFVTLLLQSGNLKNGQGLATNSVNSIITVVQCSLEMAYRVACTVTNPSCPGFGETTANCTYDAETGKCVFCGYLKPEDKHVHVYKYTPHLTDGEYDGKHTIMCTAPGCTGIGETIKNCAFDATTGKCIFCGASKPVAPIIYKPLLILTETATDDMVA